MNREKEMKEALRYLGFGRHAADEATTAMVRRAFSMLDEVVHKKNIYRVFDLKRSSDGILSVLDTHIISRNLLKNLKGCEEIVFFAATLGAGVDRLLHRCALTDMALCVGVQAAAAALLEDYCDDICDEIAEIQKQRGRYLRPRFSPGYGDFDIAYQRELTRILDTPRRIGMTITDSCMMSPTKSVSAVIGVSRTQENCHRHGCEVCAKKDCAFRRETG